MLNAIKQVTSFGFSNSKKCVAINKPRTFVGCYLAIHCLGMAYIFVPLFKEERHVGIITLVAQASHPIRIAGPGHKSTTFATGNNPMNFIIKKSCVNFIWVLCCPD